MREFAEGFYKSKAWQKCRDGYMRSRGGLCERCLERGIYRPGVIVHHKIHLTPENIHNPDVTMDWGHLMLLCRDCHSEVHKGREARRFVVGKNGEIFAVGQ